MTFIFATPTFPGAEKILTGSCRLRAYTEPRLSLPAQAHKQRGLATGARRVPGLVLPGSTPAGTVCHG